MELPPPKDLSHYYSRVLQRTQPSEIKNFYKYFFIPGIGNLAGGEGLPDPANFPYDSLEAQVALPARFGRTPNHASGQSPSDRAYENIRSNVGHSHMTIPHDSPEPDRNRKIDLSTALQYGTAEGYPPLHAWIREFMRTKMVPCFPYRGGPEVALTVGNTDGFAKVLHAFSDIWDDRKDWIRDRQGILCEEFVFLPPKQLAESRGLNIVPVAVDSEGMMVEGRGGLKYVLENWDHRKGKLPHLMYTVTVGQNPTGGVLSLVRKMQIYALCQKFDILIIEDDPYWYLQFPSAKLLSAKYRSGPEKLQQNNDLDPADTNSSSGSPFLDSLVPSYLSIDTDGRVLRLDTFSKTVAPGCRLGWITGQPKLTEAILSFTDLMTQQPSGFVQSMIAEMILGQQSTPEQGAIFQRHGNSFSFYWQTEGWIRWLEGLRGNYERRMQTMSEILEAGKYKIDSGTEKISPKITDSTPDQFEVVSMTQMLDFTFPAGGMFLWLRVCFENHSLYGDRKVSNEDMALAFWLFLTTPKYRVLAAPGHLFSATSDITTERGWKYLRLCFAFVSETVLRATSERLVECANDFFAIEDPEQILDIIRNDPYKDESVVNRHVLRMEGFSASMGC